MSIPLKSNFIVRLISNFRLKMLAGLLVAHFRGIEEVGIAFDSIVPELEQFCSKEGICLIFSY